MNSRVDLADRRPREVADLEVCIAMHSKGTIKLTQCAAKQSEWSHLASSLDLSFSAFACFIESNHYSTCPCWSEKSSRVRFVSSCSSLVQPFDRSQLHHRSSAHCDELCRRRQRSFLSPSLFFAPKVTHLYLQMMAMRELFLFIDAVG